MRIAELPSDIQTLIKSFLYPKAVDEQFDARYYPIQSRISDTHLIKTQARIRNILYRNPFLEYNRFWIDLTDNRKALDMVCSLHIIDTLIFEPKTEYFYINEMKLPLKNGVYRPILKNGRQWFFASFQAWLSEVVVKPRPKAIIGGFINCASEHRAFQIESKKIRYEYESYGSCLLCS